MFCSTCGYNPAVSEASDALQTLTVPEKFCRRCGTRLYDTPETRALTLQTTEHEAVPAPVRQKPVWHIFRLNRRGETHVMLIAAMWVLTISSWVSVLALEPMIGVALDLAAVVLALVLIFLPSTANRINGWAKIGIEAAVFVLSLWHRV